MNGHNGHDGQLSRFVPMRACARGRACAYVNNRGLVSVLSVLSVVGPQNET
jgi:hypothetical protein